MPRPNLPTRLTGGFHKSKGSDQKSPSNVPSRSSSPRPPALGDSQSGNLVLKATVLRARNLAAKDKGGTSDPYLVLTLGDARQSTPSISKTLNPEWNQTLELPITGPQSILLEVVCWDKDRFRKDYMGQFDIPLEDIFENGSTSQEASGTAITPKWYPLESRKPGKKNEVVTGEVSLEFSVFDPIHSSAIPQQLLQKLYTTIGAGGDNDDEETGINRIDTGDLEDEEEGEEDAEQLEGADEKTKEEVLEKKKRKKRIARIKKRTKQRAYEFSGMSDVAGVLFLEVQKITDLPPERNATRTGFDMDPFVVTSLNRKTYRTRVIRHNLNPVYDEKLVFQVLRHEVNFTLSFSVVDRDKFTGNDFVGTTTLELEDITSKCPEADPETGLFSLRDPPETSSTPSNENGGSKKRFRLPISRSSSASSLKSLGRSGFKSGSSSNSANNRNSPPQENLAPPTSMPQETSVPSLSLTHSESNAEDSDLHAFELPITLKNKDRWEAKHNPILYVRAKYLPYKALRQQFWRSMLKQYDADDSGYIDKVELTTMLDTLGSTLHNATIDGFFTRFSKENDSEGTLTYDQAVISLEEKLTETNENSLSASLRRRITGMAPSTSSYSNGGTPSDSTPTLTSGTGTPLNNNPESTGVPALEQMQLGPEGEEGSAIAADDLTDEKGEEHVVEIRECPICHQPRLNKRSDADIITHIATCASQDWRQVNNIVMAGFVTSSQAQRKWYSKVITKIGYGGYRIGANSANILVQDRITGQINEERMSVYVRLGIRLLYKGLKSREMEKKRIRKLLRSLSFKQGRKYDDPASAAEIQSFINFHQLDMGEVKLPLDQFKNFNEFFYRELKPDARPCSAPDRPEIVTSPADCRSVVFNRMSEAQKIWVKGREFTIDRLLGSAYPEDAARYREGGLGIFRLAPQDYHRFHIPVDGVMGEPKLIDGEYYTVNPMAIRSALDVYGENIRVIVPIDSERHGRVMVVCVGAMMVGSTVITRKPGERVRRAEELGYFKFGGSTILLLFEPGVMQFDPDLTDNSNVPLETLIRVGMSIGHHIDEVPYTPDMRKENPTHAEKQDAKRRIEGSLAPATDAGTSSVSNT
ncbi:MAG: hypothetical protein M1820_005044 [Bogoriella megaspora]|nr:MAG: hypothetical protein M1820_005044 [Bogoriella megaspora]